MTKAPEHNLERLLALEQENALLHQALLQSKRECRLYDESVRKLGVAEQALKKNHSFKTAILNMAMDCIICMDHEGRITEFNPAAERTFGFKRADVLGRSMIDTIAPPSMRKNYRHGLTWYLDTKEEFFLNQVIETTAIHANDSEFPIEISITEIPFQGGRLFTAFIRDISERKQMEEKFCQAQKMEALGTLVGGIAHDFNNTLAGMTGNLFLAKKKLADQPEVMERLQTVERLGFHAADMISQLLTFARKGVIQIHPFALTPFVKEIFKLAQVSIPENINFRRSVCSADLRVNGNATQLQQVLINLLHNARDSLAGMKKPEITVDLREWEADAEFSNRHPDLPARRFAWLTVRDNGCGIPEENLNKIFDPFFTTKGVGKGTGLGLAMAYGAVQSHGGIMTVESEVGRGTHFHIYLPLLDNETASSDPAIAPRNHTLRAGHGQTILLADDDVNVRETSKSLLESLGYRVLEVMNGMEAIRTFSAHSHEISLLILDVIMPELGGVEAAKAIRDIHPDAPVIFATGYDQEKVLSKPFPRSLVLRKPFSINILSQHIGDLLEGDEP